MRVLFIFPDFGMVRNRQGKAVLETGGWYSEGIGSLAASLKERGHWVSLYHLTGPVGREEFLGRLEMEKPDLVAFSLRTQVFRMAAEYARWASKAGYMTVAGSYHPTLNPEETIASRGFDVLCVGEGELPLTDLCERLESGREYADVPGLWVKDKAGAVSRAAVGPFVRDLDSLPLPEFSLFNFDRLLSSETFTAMASFTRGCPYACTYCINNKLKALYPSQNGWLRSRSPENAMEYLRRLRAVYPEMRYLRVMDDIFHYSEEWLERFLPLYKAEFNLPFAINHRPNRFTQHAARMLADAGCYQVYFGVEAGNEKIRNQVIGRQMTEEQIRNAFRWAREAGIRTSAYNMIALPHETMATVLDTVKLNADLRPNRIFSPIFCPYPNTRLHDISVEAGFCEPNSNYEEDVILAMPRFPLRQILFARANFRNLVRTYQVVRALPSFIARPIERIVDGVVLNPTLPHGLLTNLGDAYSDWQDGVKTSVRRRLPNFYVFLRDRVVGNRL